MIRMFKTMHGLGYWQLMYYLAMAEKEQREVGVTFLDGSFELQAAEDLMAKAASHLGRYAEEIVKSNPELAGPEAFDWYSYHESEWVITDDDIDGMLQRGVIRVNQAQVLMEHKKELSQFFVTRLYEEHSDAALESAIEDTLEDVDYPGSIAPPG